MSRPFNWNTTVLTSERDYILVSGTVFYRCFNHKTTLLTCGGRAYLSSPCPSTYLFVKAVWDLKIRAFFAVLGVLIRSSGSQKGSLLLEGYLMISRPRDQSLDEFRVKGLGY